MMKNTNIPTQLLHNEERKKIQGPAGFLEVGYSQVALPTNQLLVCHPHPQYGGTMYNKVITTVVRLGQKKCMHTCRFNYRGVGESEGVYDNATGEVEDSLAVANWFLGQSNLANLWLVGFSFGAYIAYQAANRLPVKGLILIAPAITRMDYNKVKEPSIPTWVIHGQEDELIATDKVLEWSQGIRNCRETYIIPHASHFFHGRLGELTTYLDNVISTS